MISASASITTVLQFLSGSLVCKKYIINHGTGDDSCSPFILGFLSTSLWLTYGSLIDDVNVILVNIVGCLLFLSYVAVFYWYTTHKARVSHQLLLVIGLIALVRWYIHINTNKDIQKHRVGSLSCFVSICFCASPLSNVFHVIKMKNSESLPAPLILMSTLVSFQWLLYGIILNDMFLQYPNALAFMLSVFLLSLCVMYNKRSQIPYSKLTAVL